MKKLLLFLACLMLSMPFWAQEEVLADDTETKDSLATDTVPVELLWPRDMQLRIDRLVQHPLLDRSYMGLMVWDLTADSALYRYYDQQTLRPASTMKLLTAITALDRLGGDYRFNTSLCYTGRVADSTLYGDLYVVGGMDPMLDGSDLHAFAMALRQLGIDTIRGGSIMADCSVKDTLRWGEGWCWDDKNPTLSALTLGRDECFTERFATVLTGCGLVLDSVRMGQGRAPRDTIQVLTRQHTLDQVLLKMMKESDNFFAESVLFQTAASTGHRPATARDAHAVARRLINSIGLNASDYRLADGSGLSLYNYVSAELLTRLLRYAWRRPDIYQHLLPTLPIAGQDGTLEKRMRRTAAEGNVRAKTGTLTGIVSLAGYCTAANGHELCFAIINQGVLSTRDGRSLQDDICRILCEDGHPQRPRRGTAIGKTSVGGGVATVKAASKSKKTKVVSKKKKRRKWRK